ncbi:MAG: RNA polymerase sigma-54 factor [Gammaproteobacteria bacterium]|nr:MAG: RNA polymerase sigma-54 factor [Gammaproteobacteria bacterium]
MKQSLQLKLGQQLTMTPQLQQAIRLLQLASIELQNEIQTVLESNPLLEVDEGGDEAGAADDGEAGAAEAAAGDPAAGPDGDGAEAGGEAVIDTADAGWENDWSLPGGAGGGEELPDKEIYERQDFNETSLKDHLRWQLNLTTLSDRDRQIAEALIDALADDGYLREDLAELRASLTESGALPEDVELDEMEAVLHRLQRLDPAGVAARDLGECLRVQLLETCPPQTPGRALALEIVERHLALLAAHDYPRLKRVLGVDEAALAEAERLIRSLHPRPGTLIGSSRTEYIVPDVFVSKRHGVWHVELNPELAPRLRINSYYAGLIRRNDRSADNHYLRNQLQEARWFIKSLHSRNETILRVAKVIVERQQAFLEYGEEAMKPLVLRDVAEALGMHESTISRVTTQKYMHTPRGIFEFKYFFSSHVSTADGGECSATAIRAMIRKLIGAEDPARPLSDSQIADVLAEQGIKVARRTVAKYRESLGIPASNERRRLA